MAAEHAVAAADGVAASVAAALHAEPDIDAAVERLVEIGRAAVVAERVAVAYAGLAFFPAAEHAAVAYAGPAFLIVAEHVVALAARVDADPVDRVAAAYAEPASLTVAGEPHYFLRFVVPLKRDGWRD